MRSRARAILLAAVLALLAAAPAPALTPKVRDEAHFFSADAVEKANEIIRAIKERDHKDLLIETFKSVPDDEADKVKHMDRSERERFFEQWARERARREEVNGVYVLICKEPGHVQVEVGNETRLKAFTTENRDHLRDLFVKAFKAKEYDKGLLEAVEYVRDTMRENLSERGRGHAGGPITPLPPDEPGQPRFALGGWVLGLICVGLVGLLVLVGVVSLLRRLGGGSGSGGYGQGGYGPGGYAPGGGYGPAPGYGGYGGGGGGFLSSLVGSMFGSAAGNWVYDRMFHGGGSNSSTGGGPASAPPSPPEASNQPDTDYSGAGGDFDSSGSPDQDTGGGELGSGDFYSSSGDTGGGGDVGGGDSGGGGGDSGGGGGDSGGGGDF